VSGSKGSKGVPVNLNVLPIPLLKKWSQTVIKFSKYFIHFGSTFLKGGLTRE
jgi:hypothetical protein